MPMKSRRQIKKYATLHRWISSIHNPVTKKKHRNQVGKCVELQLWIRSTKLVFHNQLIAVDFAGGFKNPDPNWMTMLRPNTAVNDK